MNDKVKHIAVTAVAAMVAGLILLLAGAPPIASAIGAWLTAMALGAGKEYGDHCATGNRWDWLDIAADAAGATIGAAVTLLI